MPAERAAPPNRGFAVAFAGVLVVAAVLRLILITQMGNRFYFADTAEYETAARSILAGHGPGPAFPRAPLYPALMAFGFWLFGEGNYAGVRMVQLLVGLSVVALTMLLGYRLGGRVAGLLAGLGAALSPTLVFTTSMLYPTALYSAVLLGVTLGARGLVVRPGAWRAVRLGGLAFLVWMTDQVALAPLAAVFGWVVVAQRRAGLAWRAAFRPVVIAFVTAALLATPWVIYHKRTYGNSAFFMEKAQIVLYFVRSDTNVAGRRTVRDTTAHFKALTTPQFVAREWRLLGQQPIEYLSDYTSEFVHFFQPMPDRIQTRNVYTTSRVRLVTALYFVPVLLLGGAGLLFGRAPLRDRVLLALVPIATAALYSLFFTQTRYRIPTEPMMLVLAALGFVRLAPRAAAAIEDWVSPADTHPAAPGSPAR